MGKNENKDKIYWVSENIDKFVGKIIRLVKESFTRENLYWGKFSSPDKNLLTFPQRSFPGKVRYSFYRDSEKLVSKYLNNLRKKLLAKPPAVIRKKLITFLLNFSVYLEQLSSTMFSDYYWPFIRFSLRYCSSVKKWSKYSTRKFSV